MSTFKQEMPNAKEKIRKRLFDYKKSKYVYLFPEMTREDREKADADNNEEATAIATIITEEVYAWFRKTRKGVVQSVGVTGTPGSPALSFTLPMTPSPDSNPAGIVWGEDASFDLINPEN